MRRQATGSFLILLLGAVATGCGSHSGGSTAGPVSGVASPGPSDTRTGAAASPSHGPKPTGDVVVTCTKSNGADITRLTIYDKTTGQILDNRALNLNVENDYTTTYGKLHWKYTDQQTLSCREPLNPSYTAVIGTAIVPNANAVPGEIELGGPSPNLVVKAPLQRTSSDFAAPAQNILWTSYTPAGDVFWIESIGNADGGHVVVHPGGTKTPVTISYDPTSFSNDLGIGKVETPRDGSWAISLNTYNGTANWFGDQGQSLQGDPQVKVNERPPDLTPQGLQQLLPSTQYSFGNAMQSSDLKEIAFLASAPGESTARLFTVPTSGGAPHQVAAGLTADTILYDGPYTPPPAGG